MKATETNLLTLMNKTAQFAIPLYQRTYAWERKHCNRLWLDVLRAGASTTIESHFVGAVVYIHEGTFSASTVPRLLVIDGQQRLTTVTLLVKALSEAAAERPDEIDSSRDLFRDYYLFNPHQRDDLKYKLMLTRHDRGTLQCVLDDLPLPNDESRRIVENYAFFVDRIRQTPLDQVVAGLRKLLIVDVSLQAGHDNPRLIFESLNSTGLDLSQADLVRNWVLMGQPLDVQDQLFNRYWYPMEQLFAQDPRVPFDGFLRDFLTLETRAIPRQDSVYEAFKTWVAAKGNDMRAIAARLHADAQLYARMRLGLESNPKLARRFADIRDLEVDPVYPYLLGAYREHDAGRITVDEFDAVLDMIESYVFRRSVCDLRTNSLNRTFAMLHGMLDANDYVQSLAEYLFRIGGVRVFPSDADFTEALVSRDMYRFRLNRYLLRKLENYGRKEPIEIRNYSIEHVMPQNEDLPQHWRAELGPEWEGVHQSRLHRLGNLTLTGYNSELSDRPFAEKRVMAGGYATSPLWLNQSVAQAPKWNATGIDERARQLAKRAVQVWPFLPLPEDVRLQIQRFDADVSDQQGDANGERQSLAHGFLQRAREAHPDLVIEERRKVKHFRLGSTAGRRFGSVIPWGTGMTLTLDVAPEDLDDPLGWCQEHDRRGSWGVGKSRLVLRSEAHLEYGLGLLAQAVAIVRQRTLDDGEAPSDAMKQYAQRHHDRYAFWTELLAFARTRTDLHARISPGYETWVGTSSGVRGLNFNYIANKHEARVELYIDRGRGSGDENFAIFDQLFASREQIEAAFRDRLEWQRLDHRRACRIAWSTTSGGYQTVEGRDELFELLVDRMMRLDQALRPRIASLRL